MRQINPPQTTKILFAFAGILVCIGLGMGSLVLGMLHSSTGLGALGALASLAGGFGCGFYAEHCASLDY